MKESLRVSGRSAVLEKLLNLCASVSPWLTLEQDKIFICWSDVLEAVCRQGVRFEVEGEKLKSLLTQIFPLIPVGDGIRHEFSPDFSLETDYVNSTEITIPGKIVPLPHKLRAELEQVRLSVSKILSSIPEKVGRQDSPYITAQRKSVREDLTSLQEALSFEDVRLQERISVDLRSHLAIQRGGFGFFLRTPSHIPSWSKDKSQQMKIREQRSSALSIARRYVRSLWDLEQFLEIATRDGSVLPENWANESPLAQKIEKLGLLERSLLQCLETWRLGSRVSPFTRGKDLLQVRYSRVPHYAKRPTQILRRAQSNRIEFVEDWDQRASDFLQNEWSVLAGLKWQLFPRYGDNRGIFDSSERARAAETQVASAIGALSSVRKREEDFGAYQSPVSQSCRYLVEWVFENSPLLTLFVSAFLCAYRQLESEDEFVIGLSPAVVAIAMSKKMFGTLPLTHYRVGEESEVEEESGDSSLGRSSEEKINTEREGGSEENSLGHQLWEKVSGSFA